MGRSNLFFGIIAAAGVLGPAIPAPAGATLELPMPEYLQGTQKQQLYLYGDNLVWSDMVNGTWDIYKMNLNTFEVTRVSYMAGHHEIFPQGYGDTIVFTRMNTNGTSAGVFMWDPENTTQPVDLDPFAQNARVYGEGDNKVIVYEKANSIYSWDPINGIQQVNAPGTVSDGGNPPDIYGDRIIWVDGTAGPRKLMMRDSQGIQELAVDAADVFSPRIYQDDIVWSDQHDIWKYNIPTAQVTRVTPEEASFAGLPSIYGQNIVWVDDLDLGTRTDVYGVFNGLPEVQVVASDPGFDLDPSINENGIVWGGQNVGMGYHPGLRGPPPSSYSKVFMRKIDHIPATSTWGMFALSLGVVAAGTAVMARNCRRNTPGNRR